MGKINLIVNNESKLHEVDKELIKRAFRNDEEQFKELTKPIVGQWVWCDYYDNAYEIKKVDYDKDEVYLDINGENVKVSIDTVYGQFLTWLPEYGTLWRLEDEDGVFMNNIGAISKNEFRVYKDLYTDKIYLGTDYKDIEVIESNWNRVCKAIYNTKYNKEVV